MTRPACLAVIAGGLALAAALLTPTAIRAGARAGTWVLDAVAERWVRL